MIKRLGFIAGNRIVDLPTGPIADGAVTLEKMANDCFFTEDSVSGITTNVWADALDLDYKGMNNGGFKVENKDAANSLNYKVLERRANYASGVDEELQASLTLAVGEWGLIALQDAHSRIKIQVIDTVGGSHAAYTIDYLINR